MKKDIKKIFNASLTGGKIDTKKVQNYARLLVRTELKEYLFRLKRKREQELVEVEVAGEIKNLEPLLGKKFKGKEVAIIENPNLLGGIRIRYDDNILDLTFKGILEELYNERIN